MQSTSPNIAIVNHLDGNTTFEKVCSVTGELYSVTVETARLRRWKELDLYIQDEFYDLTADQREFILTGITPGEFESFFDDEGDML